MEVDLDSDAGCLVTPRLTQGGSGGYDYEMGCPSCGGVWTVRLELNLEFRLLENDGDDVDLGKESEIFAKLEHAARALRAQSLQLSDLLDELDEVRGIEYTDPLLQGAVETYLSRMRAKAEDKDDDRVSKEIAEDLLSGSYSEEELQKIVDESELGKSFDDAVKDANRGLETPAEPEEIVFAPPECSCKGEERDLSCDVHGIPF